MSSLTILFPDKPRVRLLPRWLRRRKIRSFASQLDNAVQEFVSTAQVEYTAVRRKCFLSYAAKRLEEQQRHLAKQRRQFSQVLAKGWDIEIWIKAARPIESTVSAMKDTVTFDIDVHAKCEFLDRRYSDFESVAMNHIGEGRRELSRSLEAFQQRRRELPLRRHQPEVRSTLRELEGIADKITSSLELFEQVRERTRSVLKQSEDIDARLVNASANCAERFETASALITLARQSIERGDFRTAGSISNRAQQLLKEIAEDLDKLKKYTTAELQEWREYLTRGSLLSSRFLPEIEALAANVDAQTVTRWKQVRVEMEESILEIASSARLKNRAIAKRSNNSLFPDLDELQKIDVLEKFARGVCTRTHAAFTAA